jgi:integrase/recombinase XerD
MRSLRVEKALGENGRQRFVVVDEEYRIVEEITLFLNYLENRGMSEGTIETYCRDLKEYFNWLEYKKLKFYDIHRRDLVSWTKYLDNSVGKGKQKVERTKNKYLATISSFYSYYEEVGGYIELNPSTMKNEPNYANYIHHKVSKKQADISYFKLQGKKSLNTRRLDRKQIEQIYEGIKHIQSSPDLVVRNELMFRVLDETGCRIGECLGLRLSDYILPDTGKNYGIIKIVEHSPLYHQDHNIKTLERELPVQADLVYAIDEYVCFTRPDHEEFQTIFVNHQQPNTGKFMTRRPVNKFFDQLSQKVGIKCTPHYLRHTHGTELTEMGFDSRYVQQRLGHASINTTSKYQHISLEAQRKTYENFIEQRKSSDLK